MNFSTLLSGIAVGVLVLGIAKVVSSPPRASSQVRTPRERRKQPTVNAASFDDCAVSECGPDGVPLSLYAG